MDKSTFSILFIMQKGKPNAQGNAPIFARITVNHQMTHLATHYYLPPDRWLPKEGQILDRNRENGDFVEYFRKKSIKRSSKSYMAFRHFEKFCEGKCKFRDLTRKFCDRYMEYLATQARTLKPRYEPLTVNTAAAYFSAFKLALRQAYQERIIREDVANLLGNIPKRDTRKEFLTLNEVKQLAATPC